MTQCEVIVGLPKPLEGLMPERKLRGGETYTVLPNLRCLKNVRKYVGPVLVTIWKDGMV